jgi:Fe-S cluster assembly ATP-binding protein
MTENNLSVTNLNVSINNKKILNNINFDLKSDEIVVLMGPNGAGKSSLINALMGNPKYKVSGEIIFNGKNILDLDTNERAKLGLFMTFQQPVEIDGVTFSSFLKSMYNEIKNENLRTEEFFKLLDSKLEEVNFDKSFRSRFVNVGLSGGEKKRAEILQMLLLEPKFVFLDEIDSGVDVDSLKLISSKILELKQKTKMGILLITHYNKILEYIKPDRVLILNNGTIEKEGDYSLAKEILENGFNN